MIILRLYIHLVPGSLQVTIVVATEDVRSIK